MSRTHAPRGTSPVGTIGLDDKRLRYDAYHGSTGLPPGSKTKSAGEPIQHEQAVQGELGLRRAENRANEKSRIQQHDQGLLEQREQPTRIHAAGARLAPDCHSDRALAKLMRAVKLFLPPPLHHFVPASLPLLPLIRLCLTQRALCLSPQGEPLYLLPFREAFHRIFG